VKEPPIVCALPEAQLRERAGGLLAQLVAAAGERRLTDDGAILELATTPETVELLHRVVAAERECCRFLRFRLTFEPDLGPIALEITGPAGTREFLQATFGL
jgi:hypothetical protein